MALTSERTSITSVFQKKAQERLFPNMNHSRIVNIVGPSYRTKDVLEKFEEAKKTNIMLPKLGNLNYLF